MNTRHLTIFLAVCEAGSFTRAALRLSLSQPSLSRIVRDLEAAQGVALFQRTGRGVLLSEAGQLFRTYAERIVSDVDRLNSDMQEFRREIRGEISVAIPMRAGRVILAPLLRQFSVRFPRAEIYVHENLSTTNLDRVLAGEADIGMFFEPPKGPAGVIADVIASEYLYLIGRPDIVGSADTPVTISQTASVPLILPGRRSLYRQILDQALSSVNKTASVVREVDTIDGLLSFALEGEGATILPFSNVFREVDQGLIAARRIDDPLMRRDICVTTRSTTSVLVRETVALLKRVVEENSKIARWFPVNASSPEDIPKPNT